MFTQQVGLQWCVKKQPQAGILHVTANGSDWLRVQLTSRLSNVAEAESFFSCKLRCAV